MLRLDIIRIANNVFIVLYPCLNMYCRFVTEPLCFLKDIIGYKRRNQAVFRHLKPRLYFCIRRILICIPDDLFVLYELVKTEKNVAVL